MGRLKNIECLKDFISDSIEIRLNGIDESDCDVFDGNIEVVDSFMISSGEVVNLTFKIPNAKGEINFENILENIKTSLSKVRKELDIEYIIKPNNEQEVILDKLGMKPLIFEGVMYYYNIAVENPMKLNMKLNRKKSSRYILANQNNNKRAIRRIDEYIKRKSYKLKEKTNCDLEVNINICVLL